MPHHNADLDAYGHRLLVGTGAHTRRTQRQDRTHEDFAMLPPARETAHAAQRRMERKDMATEPVYAPGTHRSVVVTFKPTISTVHLRVNPGLVIGKGGHRIKRLQYSSGARLHVTPEGTLEIRGNRVQQMLAKQLLKPYIM